jgi:hypothetical protein
MKKILSFIFIAFFWFSLSACNEPKVGKKEAVYRKIVSKTEEQLIKNKDLEFIGWGGGTMVGYESIAISLIYKKPIQVEKARELTVFCMEKFKKIVDQNKEEIAKVQDTPLTQKNLTIRISIQPPDESKQLAPNLTYISARKGHIDYASYGTPYKTVHSETYEEALKIVNNQQSQKE